MKRATCLGYLGPLLFLAGCVTPDYVAVEDPSTAASSSIEEVATPAPRTVVQAPSRADVVAHWQLPTESPWLPYEKLTLPSVLSESSAAISLPRIELMDDVAVARLAGKRVAEEGLPNDTAWFVDLPGAASVGFAHALSNSSRASISAIPTFNNWPAENELIPAEETLTAMIELPPRLPADDDVAARPVFLLDSWRLAYKEEEIPEDVVDNRYMLTAADFPTAEVLLAHGIRQIVYLVASNEIEYEEDDLHDIFAAYEDAGIVIYMIDVESLAGGREGWDVPWYVEARAHGFVVRPRLTCVHDPRFYRRAHGGFGGTHLVPMPGGHVHVGFGSGG
jgi:hypothetical protein